jgi:hypothetical protein
VSTLLAAALDYATRRWSVFPCRPASKEPATKRGFYNATTNPATIRRWWLAREDYNIGIRTGAASGVWVFDIDGDAGATTVAKLKAEHGQLPDTLISATSNGCHLWFCYTSPIPCSAEHRFGRGLDVRGDGGYAMAAPSLHPDGPTYRWMNDRPLAVALDWLVELARTRPPPPALSISQRAQAARRSIGLPGAYARAALEREIKELANTLPGARNHALNRAAFSLFQLVAGGELNEAEVLNRLIEAAHANGLMTDPNDGPVSVRRTIESGRRAGMQHPRTRWGAS